MHRKIFKNNRRFLLVWFIIFTCLTGCSGIGRQQDTGNESALEEIELSEDAKSETAGQREQSGADDEDEKVSSGEICVYVCGQVKHPGVYRLDADSRICDPACRRSDRKGGIRFCEPGREDAGWTADLYSVKEGSN